MMEKRNFVTSVRTPMDGASDLDDIVDAGIASLGKTRNKSDDMEKKASEEDEKSDREQ